MAEAADTKEQAAEKPAAMTDKEGRPTMRIRVSSPFTIFFDEEAYSISAANQTGPFDILPRHHNFITLLDACEITVRNDRGETKIQISGGIMHVKADQVIVFLNV
jgi:F0F1-type ATP synthase epsilon subunit